MQAESLLEPDVFVYGGRDRVKFLPGGEAAGRQKRKATGDPPFRLGREPSRSFFTSTSRGKLLMSGTGTSSPVPYPCPTIENPPYRINIKGFVFPITC